MMLRRPHRQRLMLASLPLAVCRLDPTAPIPAWAANAPYFSITRTPRELSIVCPESVVPVDVTASRDWRAFRLDGPQPLDQTGILASITGPLAAAHVSVLAIATYDTDYVLIPAAQQRTAITALETAGHEVSVGI